MKEQSFLFSMLLNQLITLLVSHLCSTFHSLTSVFFSISWLICSIIFSLIFPSSFFVGLIKRHDGLLKKLSLWSFKVMNVSGFAQLEQRRCHNVVARSKIRVVPTSLSDVVTTSLSDVAKTLPKRCYNVATTLSIGYLGHFFSFIET